MSKTHRFLLPAAGVAVGVASTLWLSQVGASGIPTTEPLFYTGELEENGAPVSGTRDISLRLWDDAALTDSAHRKCDTSSPSTQLDQGRFRIPLDATCQAAIAQNRDLWIEVVVGATSLGRKKVGAVPYAVEAQAAQTAVTTTTATSASGALADQIVPTGAIMYFAGAACPTGWTEYMPARGRYVVGVPSGGSVNTTGVGTALTNGENRPTGQHNHGTSETPHDHGITQTPHNHALTDPGHTHGVPVGSMVGGFPFLRTTEGGTSDAITTNGQPTGITLATANANISINTRSTGLMVSQSTGTSGIAGTNAPYIQLRACQKS